MNIRQLRFKNLYFDMLYCKNVGDGFVDKKSDTRLERNIKKDDPLAVLYENINYLNQSLDSYL